MFIDYDVLVNKLREYLRTRDELIFVWLFGSMATRKANRFSDVDIAIYVNDITIVDNLDWYLELKLKLMEITKREVDLIILNTACSIIKHVANRQKVVLLSRDQLFEAEYSLSIIKEYNDVRYWARKTRTRYLRYEHGKA